jgi:DNA-directed RNA polymerase specialized sigma24 family protein
MINFSINDLYSKFINGTIERDEFEGLIYKNLSGYKSKLVQGRWTRDEYDDFVSWVYPRIHSAIDLYKEIGSSFEAYMATIIRLAAKEYRIRMITNSVTEYAAWTVMLPDQYANEETAFYLQDSNEKTETSISPADGKRVKNPRQLLILLLKCYKFVSEDFLDKIASVIGIDRDKLTEMINKMRTIREERDNELFLMRERINSQFNRCIVYQNRLMFLPEHSTAAMKMKERIEKGRKRLENMRIRMAKIRADASNRQVAQVLGISKGSVDSGLYTLKNKYNRLAGKSSLN